jgi:hypothetical protein
MSDRTRPDAETRSTERDDAQVRSGADREPTPDEERKAEEQELDPDVAAHEEEMAKRGVEQKGEGRID